MPEETADKFAAAEQGLGYLYQARLALLQLMKLPEDTAVFLEKDDDIEFAESDGGKSLGSLKHKAVGDRLTDLSIDFWKSVRIWLDRYKRDGRGASNLRFFLLTTGRVSETSFLSGFLPDRASSELTTIAERAVEALGRSKSTLIIEIAKEFHQLLATEQQDFLGRIVILDDSPRIEDVPDVIKNQYMRSIRRDHRSSVFERLEGWWNDSVIKQLTGSRGEALFGHEVSDKLSALSEEYRLDNLPITFRGREPTGEIDTENDPRTFVLQLREIGISSGRIRNAIVDYYRAFEQRSEWARESLLVSGEIEDYEDRLVDEWRRYRDVVFEELDERSADEVLLQAGKELYRWADQQSGNYESLRIRARVAEPFVTRGSFHILADVVPEPRVYWHPRFLERLSQLLEAAK